MKIVIIVQARMTSTRLPGKVLKTVNGKPLLEYQIERLQKVTANDEIVVATTQNETDLPIVELCERLRIPCFRGSENDVLTRYYGAAKQYKADIVVRVTSDCPLLDYRIVNLVIGHFKNNINKLDYVSNSIEETYPRGMDVEVFSFNALEEAYRQAVDVPDREHVTPYLYRHPDKYRLFNIPYKKNISAHRWTVDTKDDYTLVSRIIECLYPINPGFSMEDILCLMEQHPDWCLLNQHVKQKAYGE